MYALEHLRASVETQDKVYSIPFGSAALQLLSTFLSRGGGGVGDEKQADAEQMEEQMALVPLERSQPLRLKPEGDYEEIEGLLFSELSTKTGGGPIV